MYKTTTKHTKYTQPRQRFGRCWMWHANKSHGNQQALTSFESSGRNEKGDFCQLVLRSPWPTHQLILGDFIASSPICVWSVNKKGPGFLQKWGSLLAIDRRESHELQKVWHHRFVVFSSSTCSNHEFSAGWNILSQSHLWFVSLLLIGTQQKQPSSLVKKKFHWLYIYLYYLYIFGCSNPRTSWKTSHLLHVVVFFFRCLSPLVWHLLAAPGWTRSLDSTPLSHFRDPKISCHKISPTKKNL